MVTRLPPQPETGGPVNPWVLGIGVFATSMLVLHIFFGQPATCRDGWKSPSIGIQGACSNHGGVVRHNGWMIWPSIGAGILSVLLMRRGARVRLDRKDSREFAIVEVPEGYSSKEYLDLREVGFSDEEVREIIERRKPVKK